MGLQPKPTEITITGAPVPAQPQPASPSYGLDVRPVSPFDNAAEVPSLRQEIEGNWELSVFDQGIYRLGERLFNEPEEGFNPWDHLDGYELYASSLISAQSRGEIQQMKARIDSNQRVRETLARGEWGWMASLLSGVGDPVNLIPIPGAMGMGFLKGAARASAGNAALTAGLAPVAMAVDPTATWEEQAYSIGGAALFGAAFGGVAGMIGRKSQAAREARARAHPAMGRFVSAINDDEGLNISRAFNAREEEYDIAWGNTRSTSPEGIYEPVAIRDFEDVERSRQAADGAMYHYDDTHGWVMEADRGSASPRAIADEIRDELGIPAKVQKREMLVDDVALRAEYESGRWKGELGEGAIRSADEYVTFKQLEAVARRSEPKLDSETPEVFAKRVRATALAEIEEGRVSSSVMSRTGVEPWLDKLNFSPVAKGGRMFPNDNVLTDVLLQVGGDYGWAVRANKLGYKTPPSVLIRSMKHGAAHVEIKQELDLQWLKYVQQNQAARGKMFMSLNVTASAEAIKRGAQAMVGKKVITKDIFNRMAGRAAFFPEDFEIDGFKVVPEAREAAKAWTRVAQRYDAKARQLGIFYDQTSLKRTQSQAEARVVRLKAKAAQWLWGGNQAPSKLYPAIKVGDQLYFGETHDEALRAAMDELGPDIEVTPASYGYVDNLVTSNDPKPEPAAAPEGIYASAVKIGDEVFEGPNHFEALGQASVFFDKTEEELIDAGGIVDGFTTTTGRFVDRDEAGRILDPTGRELEGDGLASEDLQYLEAKLKREAKQAPTPARPQPKFRQMDDVMQGRIESLSERQLEVWNDMKADIDAVQARADFAKAELDSMAAEPHRFRDQFGNPEPFFARFWHKPKIMEDRRKMEKLLTAWYRRDQPINAEARAAKTIDDMLNADPGMEEDMGVPGLRHLHRRTLDIPNSFRINDPQLGEISVADFIETDLEIVSEAYTRTMGTKIEVAEMFGDTEMFEKMQDIKEHFSDRYLMPAAKKGESIAGLVQKRDEYLGWLALTRDAVLGGLRDKEAYNVSNRTANALKKIQVLSSMGRVLLTAAPEAMRLPMVNGFGTAFRAMWVRMFADMKTIKANTEFSKLTGVMFEMAVDRRHAQIASIGHADPGGGSSWIERKLERALPSYFKLVGLSQWTVMMKDITMFATQHRIMDFARRIDEGDNATVLAAMGISKRDAKMMAKLPMEDNQGLILPTVDQWTGPDGRRARQLLLDALAGEANRAIITPSIADRSLLFSGVAARRGQKVAESDWFSVPLQFMSFGIAANQKMLMSGLQGRDHSLVAGALAMLLGGVIANYMRTPSSALMNKSADELLLEGYEAAGLGGFWFGDLNGQIERFSRHTIGLRPALGMDPRFGKTTDVGDYVDILGPAPATWLDVAMAFNPASDASMTNRAQAIRRAVPYNNVIWWGSVSRDLATGAGKALE